jgi:H+/Cl- antiporter ClcA
MAGGLVLGVCGAVAPLALFSGQHEGQQLLDQAAQRTAWSLLGLVALKLVATLACLTTGWFGGQIFPAVFAGMAAALIVVALFPSAPVGPVAAAGAGAAATAVLRRPLASVLMMLFFFPPTAVLALTAGAGVAMLAVQLLGDRAPEPAPLSPGGH